MKVFIQLKKAINRKKIHFQAQCKIKFYALLRKLYAPILDELKKPVGGGGD